MAHQDADDAFNVYELAVASGVVALCPLPLGHMAKVAAWAPDLVIALVEAHEMPEGIWEGYAMRHVPVLDYGVPENDGWPVVEREVLHVLQSGGRILFHCKGGCGRSGMAVLRIMLAVGEVDALARLRRVRPCAVETAAQLDWAMGKLVE